MFSSLLQNPIQSPPVFIGANANMNQAFHNSVEPSPESSESAPSINLPPQCSHNIPSTFTIYSEVQASFNDDVPNTEDTPLLFQYGHLPVFTPSATVNEAWPQKV